MHTSSRYRPAQEPDHLRVTLATPAGGSGSVTSRLVERFGDVIRGLISGAHHDPELAHAIRENLVADGRQGLIDVLTRGKARGEVAAAADTDLLWRLPPALLFFRLLLTGEPLDGDYIRHLVDDLILPLAQAPDNPHSQRDL